MKRKVILLAFFAILFQSCGQKTILLNSFMQIMRGASSKEVHTMINNREPVRSESFSANGTQFSIEMYYLRAGLQEVINYGNSTNGSSYNSNSDKAYKWVPAAEEYYFIYSGDDKVIYWGFLKELLVSEDKMVVQIGNYIKLNHDKWQSN